MDDEVIGKLENATGPDRDLDALIWLRIPKTVTSDPVPPYTGSLDAALTLVPDGMFWLIGHGRVRSGEPLGACQILSASQAVVAEAEAETAILATCIAALRARSQK